MRRCAGVLEPVLAAAAVVEEVLFRLPSDEMRGTEPSLVAALQPAAGTLKRLNCG
jgi:hypothetical protein